MLLVTGRGSAANVLGSGAFALGSAAEYLSSSEREHALRALETARETLQAQIQEHVALHGVAEQEASEVSIQTIHCCDSWI